MKRKNGEGPSAAVRIRVMKRDRFTCTYCGESGQNAELEIDHIIPVAQGGSHHISNLTTACRMCNQKKGTRIVTTHHSNQLRKIDNGSFPLIDKPIHLLKDSRIYNQGVILGR